MAVNYRKQIIYRKLCCALCLCGFILDLVGFLLPNWVSYIIGGYRHYYGLFSTCIVRSGQQACGTLGSDHVNALFKAGQAFGVLGLITYFFSLVCSCIVLCWPRPWKQPLLFSASASALTTVLFTMLMLVLFFTSHPDHGSRLDFGYYIAISACVVSLLVAIFAFYIAKITSFPPKKQPTIADQELAIIDLDSVSMTSSPSLGCDNRSMEVPIILRELTSDSFRQVPPEFLSYREETKPGPAFFFNHRPSEEVMQKIKMRNAQNQTKQMHRLEQSQVLRPMPLNGLNVHNQSPSNLSELGHGTALSVSHLGIEVDTSRCTTPVEEVESGTSTV